MRIGKVLLVCSGNTCRSPMAAGLLRHLWDSVEGRWKLEVESAGTSAYHGGHASPHAVTTLGQKGLDITGHRSKPVDDQRLAWADLILTMSEKHKTFIKSLWPEVAHKVFTLGEFAGTGHDVSDPFGGPLFAYQQTAASMEPLLLAVINRILQEGSSSNESSDWQ